MAYTKSGVALSDTLWTGAAIVALVGSALSLSRILPLVAASMSAGFALIDLSCGVALLWALQSFPSYSVDRQHSFQLSQHGLPLGKYVYDAIRRTGQNRVEGRRTQVALERSGRLYPRVATAACAACPAGSGRMPDELTASTLTPTIGTPPRSSPRTKQNWIAFDHVYAHGLRTTDSFPVIFNSRDFRL